MGWMSLLLKGRKVAGKVINKAKKSDTIKLGSAVGAVEGGRHAVNKVFGKDPHEGTITGIVKGVREIIKKKKDKK